MGLGLGAAAGWGIWAPLVRGRGVVFSSQINNQGFWQNPWVLIWGRNTAGLGGSWGGSGVWPPLGAGHRRRRGAWGRGAVTSQGEHSSLMSNFMLVD